MYVLSRCALSYERCDPVGQVMMRPTYTLLLLVSGDISNRPEIRRGGCAVLGSPSCPFPFICSIGHPGDHRSQPPRQRDERGPSEMGRAQDDISRKLADGATRVSLGSDQCRRSSGR